MSEPHYVKLKFDSKEEADQFASGEFVSATMFKNKLVVLMRDAVWVINRDDISVSRVISK